MNNRPCFSVIIAVYNGGHTISRVIKSILNQSFKDFEIIIVNDGSTDNTESILRSYEEYSNIRVIHQENKGVSAARNTALQNSRGRFVVFVDADDIVDENYLLDFHSSIRDAELAICGYKVIDSRTGKQKRHQFKEEFLSNDEVIDKMLRFRVINSACWNKCFQKRIIDQFNIRFNESITIGEDLLFLIEYCSHIKYIHLSNHISYTYILADQNAMNQSGEKKAFNPKWVTEWAAIKDAEKILNKNGIITESIAIKKVRIANKLMNTLRRFHVKDVKLKHELKKEIAKNYFKAMKASEFSLKQKVSITLNRMI